MRALTVRQPYAWGLIHGGKDVENRSRNIAGAYRGPVAIHAGLTDATGTADTLPLIIEWREWWEAKGRPIGQRGCIIGVVDLVDVHENEIDPWAEPPVMPCSPWAMPNHHHLVLANPRPLATPIPAKGRLGLWTLTDALTAQIAEQVAA